LSIAAALAMLAAGLFFGQRLGKTLPRAFHAIGCYTSPSGMSNLGFRILLVRKRC
jgi:hypothetical protein